MRTVSILFVLLSLSSCSQSSARPNDGGAGDGPPDRQSPCCAPCNADEVCLLAGSFGGLGSGQCQSAGDGARCFGSAGCNDGFECRGAQIHGVFEPSCTGTAVGDIPGRCRRTRALFTPTAVQGVTLFDADAAADVCFRVTVFFVTEARVESDAFELFATRGAEACGEDRFAFAGDEEAILAQGSVQLEGERVRFDLQAELNFETLRSWTLEGSAPIE